MHLNRFNILHKWIFVLTKCHLVGGLIPTSPVIGNIEFKDIRFIYPSRDDAVIFDNLSLSVPSGSITAVVGPSGSGKSTIGSLLLRYYDPTQGNYNCKFK